MMEILPWHEVPLRELLARRANLPHALLIYGKQGIGKVEFARTLAQSLLCESPKNGLGCGVCDACGWFREGNHPDFRELQPSANAETESTEEGEEEKGSEKEKKTSQEIVITQIRDVADFMTLSTHRDGFRVLLIHPAETMNLQAANALLKTLEEPPPRTLILLVTDQIGRLLATIKSRCQRLLLPAPEHKLALAWLEAQQVANAELLLAQSAGSPITAQGLADSAIQTNRKQFLSGLSDQSADYLALADTLGKMLEKGREHQGLAQIMTWLQTWVSDLILANMAGEVRVHTDHRRAIEALAKRCSVPVLMRLESHLRQTRRSITHPLNAKLLLEQTLLSYAAAIR